MSLTKRARELWLDGDEHPYETLAAILQAEREQQHASTRVEDVPVPPGASPESAEKTRS